MDTASTLIARKMFKLRIYEANGAEFQRLFEKIIQYHFEDFTPIKPYGEIGDRKNDGYIRSQGRYFQVYAPEVPDSKSSALAAAKKAARDFGGLRDYWSARVPIKIFQFVFNDKYTGSPPPLEEALARIREDHGIEAGVFLAKDLERAALSLPDDQLIDVIGTPIPCAGPLESVDFGILREVVRHILKTVVPYTPESVLRVPDFLEKLEFNGLSRQVAALLTVGSYQSEAVTDYFSKNSTFARQELRDHLSSMYLKARNQFVTSSAPKSEIGDLVFFQLLKSITPVSKSAGSRETAAAQDAAIIVMAYYFEACDIFEDPDASA